jgi:hypothetical protein
MNFHRGTWLAVAVAVVVFALLNLHCWRPGIGGRRDRANDPQPEGTELELYYGWPACYRAELLRSDDPSLGDRVLKTAPFYVPPYTEAWASSRYFGWVAVILDASFAILGIVLVAMLFECDHRGRWTRSAIASALIIAFLLAAAYWIADMVDVHL